MLGWLAISILEAKMSLSTLQSLQGYVLPAARQLGHDFSYFSLFQPGLSHLIALLVFNETISGHP